MRHKLSRVLWVPVEGARHIPLAERRVGSPLLWSPSEEEERLLRADWEELMDMIVLGKVEQITARHGQVMQIRPKAANSGHSQKLSVRTGKRYKHCPEAFI